MSYLPGSKREILPVRDKAMILRWFATAQGIGALTPTACEIPGGVLRLSQNMNPLDTTMLPFDDVPTPGEMFTACRCGFPSCCPFFRSWVGTRWCSSRS